MEVGYVLSIKESLLYLDGLPGARISDVIENEEGVRALITALMPERVEAWVLNQGTVLPGQEFWKKGQILGLEATPAFLGRAIDPTGIPIDGKGVVPKTRSTTLELEIKAAPISGREIISDQLITGLTLIDTLIPLGKGQRQLILGDSHSGKTSFLIDLIAAQAMQGAICIYASVGKPINEVRSLINALSSTKALPNTIIVAASATDSAPLIFLTPFSAMSLARFFQSQGKDVLLILDDLGIHAKVYRELSLLGERPPGRESYPGDIFYLHSHLLEGAGKFNQSLGSGSITALPVAEIHLNDFTSLIPTNLMSMTDGHLLFKSSLRSQGMRPAIDLPMSVSRVGRQTQNTISSLISAKIRQILAQAQTLETVSRFSGELPLESQQVLKRKALIEEIIKQDALEFIEPAVQCFLLGLVLTNYFDKNTGLTKQLQSKIRNAAFQAYSIKDLNQYLKQVEQIL